ncbi:MAG: bifunctional nuclease family protein [Bilophila sp.]
MIPMIVLGLTLDGTTNAPILVLQQKYALVHEGKELEKHILPIWVGAAEAMALSLALNDIKPERPLPHDLLCETLAALGARLTAVSLVDLREGTFYALLEVLQGERLYQIDCRPSDAITLALRSGLDILVAESVLETSVAARVHPQSTEAERRPSDSSEKIVHKAGQATRNQIPADAPKDTPAPLASEQNDEQRLYEQRLADLLRTLEPATKRMM